MLRCALKRQLLIFGIGAGLALPTVATEIFRWTDSNGKVHFGDRPDGTGASQVKVMPTRPGSPSGSDRTARTERLLQEFAGERSQREADRAKARKTAEKRSLACREARSRALEVEEAGYLYDRNEDGSKRILSDAEHRQARAQAKREVAEFCD